MLQGVQNPVTQALDAAFSIVGEHIPLDHGYALYSALSRLPTAGPWLHQAPHVAIHPVSGRYSGPGWLELTIKSRLVLRLTPSDLPSILPLSGQAIDIDGHRLRIGVPRTRSLCPAAALYAHAVTTRNGHDEARFDAEIRRQLEVLEIRGKPTRGRRRVLRIKEKTVVAHSLLVTELTAQDAIRLQETGLGGRRKMGCGVFVPWRR